MAVIAAPITGSPCHIRAFNPVRDSRAATDLVELCFRENVDADGRSYLRRLHDSAYRSFLIDWVSPFEPASLPRIGLVWEEANRLIGYLSIIPFQKQHQPCYLIANVAVHPEWRGRGIGRALTRQALSYARQHHAHAAWLQVRADNLAAVHIYKTEGFIERARRTSWVSPAAPHPRSGRAGENAAGVSIRTRRMQDWKTQQTWLHAMYPADLAWHLPVDYHAFTPGFAGALYRFMNWVYPRHWVAQSGQNVLGILSYLPGEGHTDTLWLALPRAEAPIEQDAFLLALLRSARYETPHHRPLSLNLPASIDVSALPEAGFTAEQTLIWMACPF
ncbi:MAG: GNAT family N-acetyltransferase [Chloroflexota bacterium]